MTDMRHVAKSLDLMSQKERPYALCPCGAPLIGTMAFPKAEFYCLECGRHLGFLDPSMGKASAKLTARYEALQAEWDENVGNALIPPRSWRLDTCDKCHVGGEPHSTHATTEELAAHDAAIAWLEERREA